MSETVVSVMANRLSYSQLRLYSECGQKYKYYYIDRIRETTKSGALLFGSAFDKAIEAVLKDPSVDEKAVFDKTWESQVINKTPVNLIDSPLVVYAASDFDADLFTEQDTKFIAAKAEELVPELLIENEGDWLATFQACASHKKQRAFKRWPAEEQKFYNICNWLSLRRKGHLMLDANRTKVMPRIKRIIDTQKKVELNNGEDTLIGFADCVVEWEDGQITIFDYKTSSIEYDEAAVLTSPQLTIYSHSLTIPRAGYFVFRKGVLKNKIKKCSKCEHDGSGGRHKTCANEVDGKRCNGAWNETIKPEIDVQVLVDTIPTRTEDIVLENIEASNNGIKNGIFIRNFNSCKSGYGPCPYLNLCYKNEMKDLEKV